MFTQIRERARRSLAALTAVVLVAGLTAAGAALPATAADEPAPVANPVLTVSPGEISDVTKEVTLTVSGTGYVGDGAANGAYILVGGLDNWTPGSGPLVADGWAAQGFVPATLIKDGAFTTTVKVPASSFVPGQTYQVASSAAHGLAVTDRTLDAKALIVAKDLVVVPEPTPDVPDPVEPTPDVPDPVEPTPEVVTPAVTLSKTAGLNPEGETITVSGSGFLPAADGVTAGSRPPLAGKFTGAYVIFGAFADVWKPSENAPSASRKVIDQKWAVLAADMATVGGVPAGAIEVKADGTFTTTFEAKKGDVTEGNFGIYTYAGGGVKYAPFETYTPLAFAESEIPGVPAEPEVPSKADPKLTVTPAEIADVTKENTLTVSGTGFVGDGAKMGTYILVGDKGIWTPGSSKPLVVDGWAALTWVPANQIVDGKFTVAVKVPAKSLEGGKEYQVASSAAHQLSASDRTLDAQALITTKKTTGADPTPTPTPKPDPKPETPAAQAGNLQWGIDKTFVDYIPGSIAKGKIVVSKGATFANGLFNFPQNGNATAGTGTAKFFGNVAFSGHNGALDSQLGALELKFLGNNKAELWGTVTANSMSGESLLDNAKVVIAKVDLKAAVANKDKSVTYTSNGVTLTADGAKAFGNYYAAGQKVSELSFTVGAPAKDTGGEPPVDVTPKPKDENKDKTPVAPGMGAVTAPEVAGKQPEVCVARTLTGATMNWNFKATFVNYVGNLADGKIVASGVSQGSGFNWSGGSGKYNQDASKGLVSFGGSVQFSGHGGVMNSKFSNLRVQFLGANSAALIANVVASDMDGKSSTMNGIQIGTISLSGKKSTSGNNISWSNAPVTLTAAGAKAFGGFYQAGERLDPITIKATLGGETVCDTSTGTLAATGASEQTVGVMGIAVALLAAGAGIAVVGSRRKLVTTRK